MFGILKSAMKAASAVVDVPVSVAADIVTLGGALTDKDKPYTAEAAERLVKNVKDMSDPES
ncbi:hypothetical protein VWX96_17075 [Phaeobacter sp. A90a-4f]|uniref:hypothetical protein n=1 Tax=Phaeobacter TaxID=302485 RepID=UPI0021A781B5|nr:hypothetical protein [Phaeobacter inhibens]UWS06789.1 hypothetical protein K4K98_11025 [Phaeobacter inhibens]